jgi:hypothetical protein
MYGVAHLSMLHHSTWLIGFFFAQHCTAVYSTFAENTAVCIKFGSILHFFPILQCYKEPRALRVLVPPVRLSHLDVVHSLKTA